MTTGDPPQTEESPAARPMDFQRFQKIMRTGRLESAAATGTADKTQQGREDQLINADQCAQQRFQCLFEKEPGPRSQGTPLMLKLVKAGRAGPIPSDENNPKTRL